jgi:hypothetical protein
VGDIGMSVKNLYRQVLYGSIIAKTEFVAMCEDDCLYTPEHFSCFRPIEFGYNRNKWGVFTWSRHPIFAYKENRSVFSQLIAKRDSLIAAMRERLALSNANEGKLGEPGRFDKELGVTVRNVEIFFSPQSNIAFDHLYGLQSNHLGKRKKLAPQRLETIEPWGSAGSLVLEYLGKEEWIAQQKS